MRNQQLAALVEDSIGTTTANVYTELLCIAEPQLRKCKTEIDTREADDDEADWANLPQVSTKELSHLLQDLPDLSEALGYVDPSKINLKRLDHPKRTRRRRASLDQDFDEAGVEGAASSDENEEGMSIVSKSDIAESDSEPRSSESDADDSSNKRKYKTPDTTPDSTPKTNGTKYPSDALRQHLLLLTEHPNRFLIHVPPTSTAPEKWAIPYSSLSKLLFQNALLAITTTRFGPLAGRLLHILCGANDKNIYPKLDEKMLVLLSLIPQKTMRTLLHNMHRAGHIELQEVPKDGNQRRPGTT
ncbi:MAG: hypothetical protein Q9179_004656, partial [Wetmoreana sp. 5 TL-2023]